MKERFFKLDSVIRIVIFMVFVCFHQYAITQIIDPGQVD